MAQAFICVAVVIVTGIAAWYFLEELFSIHTPSERVRHIEDGHKLTDTERDEINRAYYKQLEELREVIRQNERKHND